MGRPRSSSPVLHPPGISLFLLFLVGLLALFCDTVEATAKDDSGPVTEVHQPGYCAIRGQCGKESWWSQKQLPCPDNGPAHDPESDVRQQLVELCGSKFEEGPVCCEESQIESLRSNLATAEKLVTSCPACKANFFNLFCTFTCSPDQSLFVNVTNTQKSNTGETIVTQLDHFVNPAYGGGFYDSCKDVKFPATNGYIMDFFGGAKNHTELLAFLGKKSIIGSPFQMDFPPMEELGKGMAAMHDSPKKCNDDDPAYRCACVDCPSTCPILPGIDEEQTCKVGVIPCWSLAIIIIYSVFLVASVGGYAGYLVYQRHRQRKSERMRLLQDSAPSDDEDEGDVINAGLLERPTREYALNNYLDAMFGYLGQTCASFPAVTIGVSVVIVGLLSLGWLNFRVETDPVRLWVSPTSDAAQEKQFFDDNFGPFYRTQQAFLVNDTNPDSPGPVLSYNTLKWWFEVEQRIRRVTGREHEEVTLDQVCLNPTGRGCVVQSITGYFNNDFQNVREEDDKWKQTLRSCVDQPVGCLPDFGQPLKKELLFGGYQDTGDVLDAKALVVTWVLVNHAEGSPEIEKSMDWERSLKDLLLYAQEEAIRDHGLRLSFSTEISLEQELNKSTNTDAKIVAISYIAMFIYASLALGNTTTALRNLLTQPGKTFVDSKFTLGVFGIIIVLMSVSASVGLFSALGIKVTLIIAEVIPFLVLAVGVDNIFLIVHEFERATFSHPDEPVEVRIGKAMGRMGPSILLSASCETIAFALGAIVSMPAVRNFAAYAAGAVFVNAVLQVTMFVSVLALNQKRVEAGRMDCFPCIKPPGATESNGSSASAGVGAGILGNGRSDDGRVGYSVEEEGLLQKVIRKKYAPALLRKTTKGVVVIVFLGLFAAGLALLPKVELGLDQRIAIPSDSYLIGYFNDLYDYFSAGPPVYFISQSNVTEREQQQLLCGRFTTCDTLSLANTLEQERKRPEISYISEPTASWIDDFFLWLNPQFEECCTVKKSDRNQLCDPEKPGCEVCFKDREQPWNISLGGMPEGQEFMHYLNLWLEAQPGEDCPFAGKAAYSTAVMPDYENTDIIANSFRTSHSPLSGQQDFIDAYAAARRIARDISRSTGAKVFPYSKFYIFFDQYSTIVRMTAALVCAALGCILIITSLLLGSIKTGFVVSITVCMIVVDIIGVMALWGVSLNAVSLVNLVICVGIGVEFCSHIARAFMFPSRSIVERAKVKFRGKDARAWTALVSVGGSVFSGITITKLIGVIVLAFTHSKIFEIYYFRMWLALVVVAATHALIFLPVFLSLAGGDGYVPEDGLGLEEDLRSRSYRAALVPAEYDDSSDEEYMSRPV